MNYHFRILQQRVQAIAVGTRDNVQRPICSGHPQRAEGIGDEIVQGEEENLHSGHHHADIRHQLEMLAAIGNQHGHDVDRKEKAPEEK